MTAVTPMGLGPNQRPAFETLVVSIYEGLGREAVWQATPDSANKLRNVVVLAGCINLIESCCSSDPCALLQAPGRKMYPAVKAGIVGVLAAQCCT